LFAYRLALALGRWDVEGLLEQMPSNLLTRWLAYDELEPISVGRHVDMGTGILGSLLANIHRNREVRREAFGVDEFMPRWGISPSSLTLRQGTGDALSHRERGEEKARELYDQFRNWALMNQKAN